MPLYYQRPAGLYASGGNWNDPSIWYYEDGTPAGRVPTQNDTVYITGDVSGSGVAGTAIFGSLHDIGGTFAVRGLDLGVHRCCCCNCPRCNPNFSVTFNWDGASGTTTPQPLYSDPARCAYNASAGQPMSSGYGYWSATAFCANNAASYPDGAWIISISICSGRVVGDIYCLYNASYIAVIPCTATDLDRFPPAGSVTWTQVSESAMKYNMSTGEMTYDAAECKIGAPTATISK